MYSEYIVDDSDISETWTSDSNIWQVNELDIAGTSEYTWYATVIHNVVYRCVTQINNNSNTDIHVDKYIEQLRCYTYYSIS